MSIVDKLSRRTHDVVRYFPLSSFVAIAGFAYGLLLVEEVVKQTEANARPLMILVSALAGVFATELFRHHAKHPWRQAWPWIAGGLIALLGGWGYVARGESSTVFGYEWALMTGALGLLCFSLPWRDERGETALVAFTLTLARALFFAFVYAIVTLVGLAIAIVAVDKLFLGSVLEYQPYARVALAAGFLIAPGVTLAHFLPDVFQTEGDGFPRPVTLLLRSLVLPIVALYFVIFYSYAVWTGIRLVWPEGIIGPLVSILTALVLTVIYFLTSWRRLDEAAPRMPSNPLLAGAMLPLLALLGAALWRRVSEYGVTEPRWIMMAFAGYAALAFIYLTVSKAASFRLLAAGLAFTCLVSGLGPLSSSKRAEASQRARLETTLTRIGALDGTKAGPPGARVSLADRKDLSSSLVFLLERFPNSGLDALFGTTTQPADYPYNRAKAMLAAIKIDYADPWQDDDGLDFAIYEPGDAQTLTAVGGYDYLAAVTFSTYQKTDPVTQKTRLDQAEALFTFNPTTNDLEIVIDQGEPLKIALGDVFWRIAAVAVADPSQETVPPAMRSIEHESGDWKVKVIVRDINGTRREEDVVLEWLRLSVLIGRAG